MRTLIIDDDEDMRSLLAHHIFREWPSAVVEQFDPLARPRPDEHFPLGSYDVVILDYMLGRSDGLVWLQQFKRRADCPPIIFLTGAGDEAIAVRAMKLGADDYQRKQELTRERIVAAIREVTQNVAEKTLPPDLVARFHGHALGVRVRIPGVKVLRLIGEGGVSWVYLASRDNDDEPLVVKILKSSFASEKLNVERFIGEYDLAARIQSPHVARIHAHGVSEDCAYLVMEFLDGGDLSKRLNGKAIAPDKALGMFRELMFGLGDVHEAGVLHRDLKPQNLMFRADGSLAIVDFGIAKQFNAIDRTTQGDVLGTPRYMSPEQVKGRALDRRTDIYSAGVLLYEVLTGRHLFTGETAMDVALQHLNTPPPPLPDELSRYQPLLDKLLDKDRDARFRSADEVIGFLSRKYSQGNPASEAKTSEPPEQNAQPAREQPPGLARQLRQVLRSLVDR